MSKFFAILRACLALPLVVLEVCRQMGRLVLAVKQAISPGTVSAAGPDLVSEAGAKAEAAVEELRPQRLPHVPSVTATIKAYCNSRLVPAKPTPRLDHLPPHIALWLAGLDDTEVRTLYGASDTTMAWHVDGTCQIRGVPPVGKRIIDRPVHDQAAIERQAWDEVLAEIAMAPKPRYAGV